MIYVSIIFLFAFYTHFGALLSFISSKLIKETKKIFQTKQ